MAIDGETGALTVIRGPDAGKVVSFADIGMGGGLDTSAGLKATKFYFSGATKNFNLQSLAGMRYEANISINLGIKFNKSLSYSKVGRNFVLGLGSTIGGSLIPVPVQGNFNRGITVINPWSTTNRIDP